MAQAERDASPRIFRWDGDTLRLAWIAFVMCICAVAIGFVAPWWVTVYVVALSVSLFIADRAHYWRSRQVEAMRAGNGGS